MKIKTQTAPSETYRIPVLRPSRLGKRAIGAFVGAGLTVGAAVVVAHNYAQPEHEAPPAVAGAFAQASAEFGGRDSGWEHGAAESALKEALTEGVTKLYAHTQIGEGIQADMLEEKINATVAGLLTHEGVEQALEMAKESYTGIPDLGDKLVFQVNVNVDSEDQISYEVVGAKINDISNNQE